MDKLTSSCQIKALNHLQIAIVVGKSESQSTSDMRHYVHYGQIPVEAFNLNRTTALENRTIVSGL